MLKYLKENYPNALEARFGITDLTDPIEVSRQVAIKRGLISAGQPDLDKADFLILKEFKEGKLGRITLEKAL